jgi:hypothetical protein
MNRAGNPYNSYGIRLEDTSNECEYDTLVNSEGKVPESPENVKGYVLRHHDSIVTDGTVITSNGVKAEKGDTVYLDVNSESEKHGHVFIHSSKNREQVPKSKAEWIKPHVLRIKSTQGKGGE